MRNAVVKLDCLAVWLGIVAAMTLWARYVHAEMSHSLPVVSRGAARIALVIGNNNYADPLPPLANPKRDADAMAEQLTQLGFQTTLAYDLTLDQMKKEVRAFANKLHPELESVALVFYAGHAMQIAGGNYLLPVDADISTQKDVAENGYELAWLFDRLRDAGALNILILDSCRNNPFKHQQGWADGLSPVGPPRNTFMAYATQPDQVALEGDGEHSPYTSALLTYMPTPALKIEEVFKRVRDDVDRATANQQLPWEASTLQHDFYFHADTGPNESNAVSRSEEEELWVMITRKDRADLYARYLERYPDGQFVGAARRMLSALAPVSQARTDAEVLRDSALRAVLEPASRDTEERLPTGDARVASLARGIVIDTAELQAWEQIRQSDQVSDFDAFVRRFPTGFFASSAERMSRALQTLDEARSAAERAMESQNRKHGRLRIVPPDVE